MQTYSAELMNFKGERKFSGKLDMMIAEEASMALPRKTCIY